MKCFNYTCVLSCNTNPNANNNPKHNPSRNPNAQCNRNEYNIHNTGCGIKNNPLRKIQFLGNHVL